MNHYQFLSSPLGQLRLVSNGKALVRIEFPGRHDDDGEEREDAVLRKTTAQLQEYFAGEREAFDLPLAAAGTDFQHSVWHALREIPFGEQRSYRDIADSIGNDASSTTIFADSRCAISLAKIETSQIVAT